MDNTILGAIIGVVGGVVGVWFGFRWSEAATKDRERRTEQRQRKAILRMLSAEVERNLRQLDELWKKVVVNTENTSGFEKANSLLSNIAGLELKPLEQNVFESLLSVMGLGLSREEAGRYLAFYSGLEDVQARLEALRNSYQRGGLMRVDEGTIAIIFQNADRLEKDVATLRHAGAELLSLADDQHEANATTEE